MSNSHTKTIRRGYLFGCCALPLTLVASMGCGVASNGLNAEGTRFYQQGNNAAAVRRFEEAIAMNPRDADSYYNLGASYHQLAKAGADSSYWSQAENYYNQCLDFSPNHKSCYRGLAVLLAEQNRHEQAMRLLQGWKDRNPVSPEPKVELARLYEELGDRSAAESQLLEAIAVDTTHARARAALGKLREDAGDYDQALANYNVALQRNRVQPQLKARVAALHSSVAPGVVAPTPSGTLFVNRPGNTVRY